MRIALIAIIAVVLSQEKPTWVQIITRGEKNLERLRTLKSTMPQEGFDPAALSKSLGGDPDKAAEFLRTQIAGERCELRRAPRGARVAARGMGRPGAAPGDAGRGQISRLVKRIARGHEAARVRGDAGGRACGGSPDRGGRHEARDRSGAPAKKVRTRPTAAAAHEQAWTRIRRDLDAVASALQSAGATPSAPVAPPSDEVWWVRIGDKDYGRPDGAEEKSVHSPAELPADGVHKVTIRMKIRQGETETTVLDVSLRTMEVFGRVLTLSNVAGEDPKKLTRSKSVKIKDQPDVMAATGVFVPLLTGGGKPISGHPFDLTGSGFRCRTA
jgi:hypothetical protein